MQPVPTKTESELVNQVARLTQSKRTDVIKNALAVYNWSVCHAMTGARLIARIRQEKRLSLRLPNSSPLKPKAIASAPRNSAYLPRSSRTPRVPMPPAVFRHLLDRIQNRKFPSLGLNCWPCGMTRNRMSRKASRTNDFREWSSVAKTT